jgi:hypothetical protein
MRLLLFADQFPHPLGTHRRSLAWHSLLAVQLAPRLFGQVFGLDQWRSFPLALLTVRDEFLNTRTDGQEQQD